MSTGAILEVAFALLPLPILITDRQGKIVLTNKETRRLTGAPNLVGESLTRLCAVIGERDSSLNLRAIAERGSWRGQVMFLSPGGERALYLEGCPIPTEAGDIQGYLFMVDNPHQGAPERQQKLELIGSIAGGVAHDLNNILTGILGHISYLRLALGSDSSSMDSLAAIEDGARKAASTTNQILEFARGEPAKQHPVNLSLVVASGVNLIRAALPRNIELRVEDPAFDIFVQGDEGQLSQIFMNLAVNAADALHNGGEISVHLERARITDDPEFPPGEYAVLAVVDNGMGMSSEVQQKIFQPFFTTKAKRGTGLGLANVFSLVRLHGGRIEVDSEIGRGSRFSVYLPAISEAPQKIEQNAPESGTELILVVEDEEIVRTVIQKSLEHLGYSVVAVSNGREAVELYREKAEQIQLVILDMMMPLMSGDEVYLRLREINPEVGVLVASGYSSDVRSRAVMERGGLGFIGKPFSVDELAREVRRCLELVEQKRERARSH